jgi:glycosyltransferase involved in cell wall biosynthesis
MSPTVTVTFVGWKRQEALRKGIESTLMQTYQQIEILVLDNSPTDEIYQWLLQTYPQVKAIKTAHPIPLPAARNILVASAKGKYVIFHDDDSRFSKPEDVEKAVKYLESHSQVACLAFRVGSSELDVNPQFEVKVPTPTYTYVACATIFHRADFMKAGWYFEDYWLYGEELIMSLGFFGLGKEIHAFPDVFIIHQPESIGRAKDNWKQYLMADIAMKPGAFLLMFPFPDVLYWYPILLVFYTIQGALIRRRPLTSIFAFFKSISLFGMFWKHRRPIPHEEALRWLDVRSKYQEAYYKRTEQWTWFRKYLPATR